ncbi:hypothetical protein GCM10027280_00500 [Micromonospora polyrhachis]|uniref:Uncharacterized membrane protein YidH (DUF202 family) n=1 Tax=Micromonospora polyrhachis TaxID=1282883 RepID=A0A7W7SMT4_9ACTN|nr:DUF202 domain-containing protein [Micromonospora polyrhachis]MBB4957654.1 uncharacterized membrane protein YidH (DUF202 family) [Micromonospora polyrhachis]
MSRPPGPPPQDPESQTAPQDPEPGAPPQDPESQTAPENAKPGLFAERTRLAWLRSNLAIIVVTLLLVRLALIKGLFEQPRAARSITGVTLAGCLALTLITLPWVTGRARRHTDGGGAVLPLVALIAVGLAMLGVLFILVGEA